LAGAVDGDFRAEGLDGWGWVSCFLEGVEEVWRGGDEVWAVMMLCFEMRVGRWMVSTVSEWDIPAYHYIPRCKSRICSCQVYRIIEMNNQLLRKNLTTRWLYSASSSNFYLISFRPSVLRSLPDSQTQSDSSGNSFGISLGKQHKSVHPSCNRPDSSNDQLPTRATLQGKAVLHQHSHASQ
jgi:hypothetical protein